MARYLSLAILGGLLAATSARADRVTILADVGVAPAIHIVNSALLHDGAPQIGLKFSLQGIITREIIQKYKHRIPANYRGMVERMREVRIRPLWYLPDTLFISPKIGSSQMYGITFRPIGIGAAFGHRPRLSLDASVLVTYAYYQSDNIAGGQGTHFLRPGIGLTLDFEIPITNRFLLSLGWQSQFYVPQEFGGFGIPKDDVLDNVIWHIGQAYLMFHFRFPYTTEI